MGGSRWRRGEGGIHSRDLTGYSALLIASSATPMLASPLAADGEKNVGARNSQTRARHKLLNKKPQNALFQRRSPWSQMMIVHRCKAALCAETRFERGNKV